MYWHYYKESNAWALYTSSKSSARVLGSILKFTTGNYGVYQPTPGRAVLLGVEPSLRKAKSLVETTIKERREKLVTSAEPVVLDLDDAKWLLKEEDKEE
jgi:hypothetical protein